MAVFSHITFELETKSGTISDITHELYNPVNH